MDLDPPGDGGQQPTTGSEYDQGDQRDLFNLPRASPREDLGDEEPFDATLSNAIGTVVTRP